MKNNDVERILISKEELEKRVEELGKQISDDYEGKDILAVGILKGSVVFLADLIRKITCNVSMDFMTVSSYGNGVESSGELIIKKELDTDI